MPTPQYGVFSRVDASTPLDAWLSYRTPQNPRFWRHGGAAVQASRVIYHRWRYSGSVLSDPSYCPHLQECLSHDHTFSPRPHNTGLDLTVFYHTTQTSALLDHSYRGGLARSQYVLTAPGSWTHSLLLFPRLSDRLLLAVWLPSQTRPTSTKARSLDARSRRLWRCLPMQIFDDTANAPESQHLTFINHCPPETRDPKLGSSHEAARILTREPNVCAVVEPEAQGTWHPKA